MNKDREFSKNPYSFYSYIKKLKIFPGCCIGMQGVSNGVPSNSLIERWVRDGAILVNGIKYKLGDDMRGILYSEIEVCNEEEGWERTIRISLMDVTFTFFPNSKNKTTF